MSNLIYDQITARVLDMMEEHGANWINPFSKNGISFMPQNIESKKHYRGINIMLLKWAGFSSSVWGTYRQWEQANCQVKKGSKGTKIIFWQSLNKPDDEDKKSRMVLKQYTVFNADQVEGYVAPDEIERDPVETLAEIDAFFAKIPADVRHSAEGRAYYSPAQDFVHVPNVEIFEDTPTSTALECYYSTLSHELAHWTGHKTRLDRTGKKDLQAYAEEELVAELSAAFMCSILGISSEPRPDHAHYLNSWMAILKDNKRALFSAASAATKAVDYLQSFSSEKEDQESEKIAA